MPRFISLGWFIILVFASGLQADLPLYFSCRENEKFSFSLFGARLAYRFETKLIKPAWKGSISQLAGDKPILLSEFSFGTASRGYTSAVENVPSQKLRGLYYQNYVQTAATLNGVVGCHWFEYVDQALTGRFIGGQKGERGNYGLVDIADRPYEEFLGYVIKTNFKLYDLMAGKTKPLKYSDIPKP